MPKINKRKRPFSRITKPKTSSKINPPEISKVFGWIWRAIIVLGWKIPLVLLFGLIFLGFGWWGIQIVIGNLKLLAELAFAIAVISGAAYFCKMNVISAWKDLSRNSK